MSQSTYQSGCRSYSCEGTLVEIGGESGLMVMFKRPVDLPGCDTHRGEILERNVGLAEELCAIGFVGMTDLTRHILQQLAHKKQLVGMEQIGRMPVLVTIIYSQQFGRTRSVASFFQNLPFYCVVWRVVYVHPPARQR